MDWTERTFDTFAHTWIFERFFSGNDGRFSESNTVYATPQTSYPFTVCVHVGGHGKLLSALCTAGTLVRAAYVGMNNSFCVFRNVSGVCLHQVSNFSAVDVYWFLPNHWST